VALVDGGGLIALAAPDPRTGMLRPVVGLR
jgi:hypothetical protein